MVDFHSYIILVIVLHVSSKLILSFATETATRYISVQWLNDIHEGIIHCVYVCDEKKFAEDYKEMRELKLLERIYWNNWLVPDWERRKMNLGKWKGKDTSPTGGEDTDFSEVFPALHLSLSQRN